MNFRKERVRASSAPWNRNPTIATKDLHPGSYLNHSLRRFSFKTELAEFSCKKHQIFYLQPLFSQSILEKKDKLSLAAFPDFFCKKAITDGRHYEKTIQNMYLHWVRLPL